MERLASATLDVREMQCAQALAQAGVAMKGLAPGAVLELLCNAEDVKRDLFVWAKALGHTVVGTEEGPEDTRLRIRRGP